MIKHIPRIFIKDKIYINQIFYLSQEHIRYIKKVLRMQLEDIIEIFNDTNYIFIAKILNISKENITIKIIKNQFKNIESPLHIHLGQVISKNEKMKFTIQKSIEMGVNSITPLFLKYNDIQKKSINIDNKITRWKKIAISACQQCNRNIIPKINDPINIFTWCKQNTKNDIRIILDPKATMTIDQLPKFIKHIKIIIGSEKGFLENEINKINKYGFIAIKLGPRILRTETASIAAITALQIKFGDL